MKKSLLLLFIILNLSKGIAQTSPSNEAAANSIIDSLQKVLKTAQHDTTRIIILNSLAREHLNISEYEQAILYANKALDHADRVSTSANLSSQISEVLLKGKARAYNSLGLIHDEKGDYATAIEFHFKALKIREEMRDKRGMAASYNNIGMIYSNKDDFDKALEFYFKSLKIKEETGDKRGIAASYNNIGNIHRNKGDYTNALEFYYKAVKTKEGINDVLNPHYANMLNNIGSVYNFKGETAKALEFYFKTLKIREEIGDKQGMAETYSHISVLYLKKKSPLEARRYQQKSLQIAKEIDALPDIMNAYQGLALADSALGNFKEAFSYYKLYTAAKDSIFSEEANKKTVQSEMNFEFEKKEAVAKAEQEKKDAIALEELQQQKMQRNGFIGGFALMLLLAGVSYNSFRNKRKANTQLAIKNALIEEKQKEILDSITYAKRIQNAILPPNRIVKEHLPDSFILYKPKDIVAGDFYWLETVSNEQLSIGNKENPQTENLNQKTVLFAVADCTGHGVPGAMVSVICNNGLNRSVREHNITDPGKILDKTKEIVIAEFEKSDEEVKDGMDISLCALNKTTNQILWAGANNPLWVIRNNEIIELKPDKQPIGKYAEGKPFTTHQMQLQKGDLFYIFTDGYADQFGGEKGKKFKSAKLKELLLSIHHEPMSEQKRILEETFETWKGSLEQVDDVCVMGIRI